VSLTRAYGFFEQAAARDPSFALAHVGMADSQLLLEQYADRSSPELTEKAEVAVRKALAIDDTLAEAHTTLAAIHQNRWEWDEAEAEFKRAIALNPDYPTARQWYNLQLRYCGRPDEALTQVLKAQQLDPLSMIIGANVVGVLSQLNRTDEAIAMGEKYMEIDPSFPQLLRGLGTIYSLQGRHQEAIASARKAVDLSGGTAQQMANLAGVYARAGERKQAGDLVTELEARKKRGQANSYYLAVAYAGVGDHDRALAALSAAVDERSGQAGGAKADPAFEKLRSDPRFAELLRRMHLPA